MWGVAFVICLAIGIDLTGEAGYPTGRSIVAISMLALSILIGSKLLYVVEQQIFPSDDYVPAELRGWLHGFRIPGGIVMLAIATPLVCRLLGLRWREFGDAVVVLPAIALFFIRFGCFLNGCCFGKVSSLPWAVRVPAGSWVFWYHRSHGWIPPNADSSLPVHPLQIYFMGSAILIVLALSRHRRQKYAPGELQMLFYALFFTTTVILERMREAELTLNGWIAPAAAGVSVAVLVGWHRRYGRACG